MKRESTGIDPNSELILWNKLGSLTEIQNSEVGVDGTLLGTGSSYVTGKFGNAINIPSFTTSARPRFIEDTPNRGTIELWWNPDFNSSDTSSNFPYQFRWNDIVNASHIILIYDQRSGANEFELYMMDTALNVHITNYDVTFSAGAWYHIAVCWDSNGINGTSDYWHFYFDGVRQTVTTGDPETSPIRTTPVTGAEFFVGNDGTGVRGGTASFDNLKIYNYAKTDFSDRNTEAPFYYLEGTKIQQKQGEEIFLWNTLGSTSDVEKSVIGEGATLTGSPAYNTAKFGEGMTVTSNGIYADFPVPSNMDRGAIELWFKPNYASTNNTSGTLIGRSNTNPRVGLRWLNSTTGFQAYVSNSPAVSYKPTFSSGDLLHLAVAWDSSGIGGSSDTIRFYVDGVQQASTTSAYTTPTQIDMRLGNENSNASFMNGTLDNFKYYNYAKTDFSDREQASPPIISGTKIQVDDRRLTLWSTLSSANEAESPRIGADGTTIGTITYASGGNFGNVAQNTLNANNAIKYLGALTSVVGGFTIEFWFRFDTLAVSNITVFADANESDFRLRARDGFMSARISDVFTPDIAYSFVAGTWVHISIVMQNNGIGTTNDTARIYANNQVIYNTSAFVGVNVAEDLYVLNRNIDTLSSNAGDISMENLKIYNYAKTDFGDSMVQKPTNIKDIRL